MVTLTVKIPHVELSPGPPAPVNVSLDLDAQAGLLEKHLGRHLQRALSQSLATWSAEVGSTAQLLVEE